MAFDAVFLSKSDIIKTQGNWGTRRRAPENIEIRYLRFAVQINLPGFLNHNNREEDKQFLIESLILQTQNTIPDEFKHFVMDQMVQSEEITQEEKSRLNLLLSKK